MALDRDPLTAAAPTAEPHEHASPSSDLSASVQRTAFVSDIETEKDRQGPV